MKKKALIVVLILAAAAMIAAAAILIGNSISSKESDSGVAATEIAVQQEPWDTAYFIEMRSMYPKLSSDSLTKDEAAYNALVDELNAVLDQYQQAVADEISPEEQSQYDDKVRALLTKLEAASQKIGADPQQARDTLLEALYELEAEIDEASGDAEALGELKTKVYTVRVKLDRSDISPQDAQAAYEEYKAEFELLRSSDTEQ
jgi:Skp family chaperone for outer membrane proteins